MKGFANDSFKDGWSSKLETLPCKKKKNRKRKDFWKKAQAETGHYAQLVSHFNQTAI